MKKQIKLSELPEYVYVIYRPSSITYPTVMIFAGYEKDNRCYTCNGQRALFVPWRTGRTRPIEIFKTYDEAYKVLKCIKRYDEKLDEDYSKNYGYKPPFNFPTCVIEKVKAKELSSNYYEEEPKQRKKEEMFQCEQCGKPISKNEYGIYGCVCACCAIENT